MHTIRLPNQSIRIMVNMLSELGLPIDPVFRAAGLDLSIVLEPEHMVTRTEEISFQRAFVDVTRHIPGVWLRVGLQYRLMTYGALGLAVLTSTDVAQGLDVLRHFQLLTYSLMRYEVLYDGIDPVGIIANDEGAPGDLREFLHERALGSVTSFLQDMQQGQFPLTGIDSVLDRPPNWQDCDAVLGTTVHFNADSTCWYFEPGTGSLLLPLGCSLLEETYRQQCVKLIGERRYGDNFLSRVYEAMVRLHRQQPTAERVAEQLHVSVRTLHRRLARNDTSFSDVLNRVRKENAKELLAQTLLPIEDVAEILGYAEAASFSRAFKNWTGMPPSTYRQKARQ